MDAAKGVLMMLAVMAIVGLIVGGAGCTNYSVEAGYVGYIYEKPLLTSGGGFVEAVAGPNNTPFCWRKYIIPISVMQYTVDESFSLLAKDDLQITFKAHCMVSVKSDAQSIRETVEKYCGDKWYNQFYEQRFRAQIYDAVREHDSRSAKENRAEIAEKVLKNMQEICKGTPFVTHTVVVGNVEYPQSVQQAVERKLSAQQEQERAKIEIQIAEQKALVKVAEAKGIAEAQQIINSSLTTNYLRHEYVKALEECAKAPNTTIIYVPLGKDGLPFVADIMSEAAGKTTPPHPTTPEKVK